MEEGEMMICMIEQNCVVCLQEFVVHWGERSLSIDVILSCGNECLEGGERERESICSRKIWGIEIYLIGI